MLKLASSSEFMQIPLSGPAADLTVYDVYVAVVPEGSGEPADDDYQAAVWLNGEVTLKLAGGGLAPGFYSVYARITAGEEDVRLLAGRLRVGDSRK